MTTPKTIADVMREHPTLCDHGWGDPRGALPTFDLPASAFEDARRRMRSADFALQVGRATAWLQAARGASTAMRRLSSYGAKHKAEDWAGAYVSNGALITAALLAGWRPVTPTRSGPNCTFRRP